MSLYVRVSGAGETNVPVCPGLLKANAVRQMDKGAIGVLGKYICVVLYSSVIIQINRLGQMVGFSGHAVCLFCMQMKCLHIKRALGRVQNEAASSAYQGINVGPRWKDWRMTVLLTNVS